MKYDILKYIFDKIIFKYDLEGNLHLIGYIIITEMRKNELASKIKKIVGHRTKYITDGVYIHWGKNFKTQLISLFTNFIFCVSSK